MVAADPTPRVAAARDAKVLFQLCFCCCWDDEAFDANALVAVFLTLAMIGCGWR